MVRLIPLLDARALARENERAYARLKAEHEAANARADQAQIALDESYRSAFDHYVAPFAEQFARLRNVDLDDIPTLQAVPELKSIDVKLQKVSAEAVQGLTALAGGTAAGAAAGGITFAAVGALATASTGTAIGTLSGAAATSATLAWLGGGSLAAGGAGVAGGTIVLTSIVAAPAVIALGGFLWWKGNRDLQKQQKTKQDLRRARAKFHSSMATANLAIRRTTDTAKVVKRLTKAGTPRLEGLQALIDVNDDYATYSNSDKALVAELAGLATTLVSVMRCPILDKKGAVTELSTTTLEAATRLAQRMAA